MRILRREGDPLWVRIDIVAALVLDGTKGFRVVIMDITERKSAEEKFKSLAENAITGIYAIQNNLLTYVNPKFAEIFGYNIDECLNKATLDMLVYPEDLPIVKENVKKRLSGEEITAHYELRGIKKSGEIIHLEVYGSEEFVMVLPVL